MQIVYAQEDAPQTYSKSIFLVGPTPRDPQTASWRPKFIDELEQFSYDGVVFSPEPRGSKWRNNYIDQVQWEKKHLEMADVIVAWVPRNLDTMPAFTTNVEFGRYVASGKLLYGRPFWASKCRYLDWMYQDLGLGEPFFDMEDLAQAAAEKLEDCASRTGGERNVPLHVWRLPSFQSWYQQQLSVGNRLDDARLLWNFVIPHRNTVFSYVLWVNIWIENEQRHKENEFIFTRNDLSCVLAYHRGSEFLDTKIVLVKEFRSPVRNNECFVYELPGGSSFKPSQNAIQIAADELREETGLSLSLKRFRQIQSRQLVSTLSTHHATLFAVELDCEEMGLMEASAQQSKTFGVAGDSERTYIVVKTLRECLSDDLVDCSMLGMIFNGLSQV